MNEKELEAYAKLVNRVNKLEQELRFDEEDYISLSCETADLRDENIKLLLENNRLTLENEALSHGRPQTELDAAKLAVENTELRTQLSKEIEEYKEARTTWQFQKHILESKLQRLHKEKTE